MTWNLESKCCNIIIIEETRDPIQITLNYGNYTHFFDNGNVCVGKKRGWQNPTSFIWQCVSDGADSVSGWHGLTLCWMMTLPSCAQPPHQHRLISFDSTSVSLAFALCANEFCTLIRHEMYNLVKLKHLTWSMSIWCRGLVLVVLVFVLMVRWWAVWRCWLSVMYCGRVKNYDRWHDTSPARCSPAQPSPAHASPQLRGDQTQPTTRALDWIFNNDNKLV